MNTSPYNYIAAAVLAAILWLVTGVLLIGPYMDSVALENVPPETFRWHWQMLLGIGSLICFVFAVHWFYIGSKHKTLGDLPAARRRWLVLLGITIILAAVLTMALVIWHLAEGLSMMNYLVSVLMLSFCTFVYFWVTSYLWSPDGVMYVIPLRK